MMLQRYGVTPAIEPGRHHDTLQVSVISSFTLSFWRFRSAMII